MIDITRQFELKGEDGRPSECCVRFFDSRPSGRDWQVSFTISGIDPAYQTPRAIYGIDALQALTGAIKVESSASYREGRLTWLGTAELGMDGVDDRTRSTAR